MNKDERICLLEEAQNEINSAIHKIKLALKGTRKERSAKYYIIGHLEKWANNLDVNDDTIPVLIYYIDHLKD